MSAEIESVYASALTVKKPGVMTGQTVPAGVTPLSWSADMPIAVEVLSLDEFRASFAEHIGEQLALAGLGYSCTSFAKLIVQDRPALEVRSQGGRGIPRIRPRVFIVHALGWGHKVPDYVHEKVWPHAIGADVPESSKRPKGDIQ